MCALKNNASDWTLKKYRFSWDALDIMIGGKSSIDLREGLLGFAIQSAEDADRFIRSYGYDLEDPIERAELQGNFHEALSFIRRYFLYPENPDGLKIDIPKKILDLSDPKDLLLIGNLNFPGQMRDSQGMMLRNWACSILKVMHTIAHADKDIRWSYFPDIQKQILDRFYKVIHRDSEGGLYLAEKLEDPLRVKLAGFETKPKKTRESILLKLLHKKENVTDDIFDQVGIRFVTPTALDALRVVKYLKDSMVVMPPNIKPSRCRNTLIDLPRLKEYCDPLYELVQRGDLDPERFERDLEVFVKPPQEENGNGNGHGNGNANPHSSEYYRSIQFTGRQLIKITNPLYKDMKKLKTFAKNQVLPDELKTIVEGINLKYLRREIRFFYPYEVQVTDQSSHTENERGRGAHTEYKKSQIQSAMKRVMGNFMNAAG